MFINLRMSIWKRGLPNLCNHVFLQFFFTKRAETLTISSRYTEDVHLQFWLHNKISHIFQIVELSIHHYTEIRAGDIYSELYNFWSIGLYLLLCLTFYTFIWDIFIGIIKRIIPICNIWKQRCFESPAWPQHVDMWKVNKWTFG